MTGSIAAVVFLTLIACLVLTVPIGFSLGIASLGYILYTKADIRLYCTEHGNRL